MATATDTNGRKALLDLGRAVFDSVLKKLPDHLAKALEPHRAEVENRLKQFQTEVLTSVGMLVRKELDVHASALTATYEKRLDETNRAHEDALSTLRELLTSLPPAHVHIPAEAIRVEVDQKPSQVHLPAESILVQVQQASPEFHFPKDAIKVEVDAKPSIVNVPKDAIRVEQQASIVNVPENAIQVHLEQGEQRLVVPDGAFRLNVNQPAPVVNVNTPKRKAITEKKFVYDPATQRPTGAIEETTEEDVE